MVSTCALLALTAACACAAPRGPAPAPEAAEAVVGAESWSDMIADAYVRRLKSLFKRPATEPGAAAAEPSALKRALSLSLRYFKAAVFDRLWRPPSRVPARDEAAAAHDPKEDAEVLRGAGGAARPAPARLVLAVPAQCPARYRRDWLGFCRMLW